MKTRPKSCLSQWWLTRGCISASCTAFGTWNLSISSIILEQIALPLVFQSPPIATKRSDLKSAEMGEAQIWGDLATCPMTSFIPAASMSGGGVTSLVTGPHPPTHSLPGRGGSKAEVREPKTDGLEWCKEERNKDRKNAWKLVNLYHVWINCQQY